jgi:tetratricopeptide (TPR) repeat protein
MATMILIMLLATALRLHDLSADSLWGDEIFEVLKAQRDFTSILSNSPLAVRLTLTHTFMLIGDQDFLFRFSYAVMGILGVAVMYKVGQALFNDVTGLVAAFLLAISQFHIHFSQEGRSYSWTVFLVLTSLYCLYLALQDNQMRHWIGFSITTAISMSNHLTAASVVASQIAYGALVLLIDRLLGPRGQQPSHGKSHPEPSRHQGRLATWLRRLRSSRGVMLAVSAFSGIAVFLLVSGAWFSYLRAIEVGATGSAAAGSDAVVRISGNFIRGLLTEYGAGDGLALYLFATAFVIGLAACVAARQWRQLLLAPLWILPPFFLLPRISSTVSLRPNHLIFILPIYLLYIARGITGISEFFARYAGRSTGARRKAGAVSLLLMVVLIAGLGIEPVRAYYKDQKENWKAVAAFLAEQAEPGEPIVQLQLWPTDPLRYYMRSQSGNSEVLFGDLQSLDENDLPATVWWVIHVGQRGTRPSPLPAPEELGGSEFATYSFDSHPFKSPAVLRRKTPIATRSDLLQVATRVILVQAQADAWHYFEGHLDRLDRIARLSEPLQLPSDCPPEMVDPNRYLQIAREQFRYKQREAALDSVLKAMALYEVLYPGHGRPHESVLEALYALGDSALESGHKECSVLFYSRAADARMLDVQTDPESIEHWQKLGETALKARRHEDAVAAFERLLELAPGHREYIVGLAKSYRAGGQREKGMDILKKSLELYPGEPQLLRPLADAYFLGGRMDEAAIAFQQILEVTPGDIEARFGLALAHDALGRESQAVREFQTLIEIDPDHWLVPEAKERLEALEQ